MSRPYFLRISQDIIDNNREFIQSRDLEFYKGNYIWPELLDTINIEGQDTNSNALVESTIWPRIREDNPETIIYFGTPIVPGNCFYFWTIKRWKRGQPKRFRIKIYKASYDFLELLKIQKQHIVHLRQKPTGVYLEYKI